MAKSGGITDIEKYVEPRDAEKIDLLRLCFLEIK
jgi:hypothetical protein